MAGSLLDELRVMEANLRAHSTKEIMVAGSGGRIAVRYRPPAREQLDAVVAAYSMGEGLTADQELQLLVDCCDTVVRCDPVTGETEPFDDQGPLRFDASDARWQDDGEEIETARACVSKLFRLDVQPLAASRHVGSLITWLQGVDAEITARVEGNSPRSGDDA